jgi:hypothetical protein
LQCTRLDRERERKRERERERERAREREKERERTVERKLEKNENVITDNQCNWLGLREGGAAGGKSVKELADAALIGAT